MKCKVYQKNEKRWVVQLYWKGERYRRQMWDENIPLKAKELAEILATSINTDIKVKGKYFDPRVWFDPKKSELNFEQYALKWLRGQEYLVSHRDIESYWHRWVIPFFKNEDLRDIRKGHIKDFLRTLESHYAPKTQRNIMRYLGKMFRDAHDDELILRVPPMPTVSVPETELKYMTQEQVHEVFDRIPERDQPIFKFGHFYALRPGEVRALQWDQIDYEKKIVTIKRTFSETTLKEHTKPKQIRNLPLMTEALSILDFVGRGIAGFVFRTRYGKPYRKQRLGELWRRAGGEIPLYNAMRHSRAMHLLEHERWDIEYVRALLGHTKTDMTRRYARASAEGLRKRYGDNKLPRLPIKEYDKI